MPTLTHAPDMTPFVPNRSEQKPFDSFDLLWKALREAGSERASEDRRSLWRTSIASALVARRAGACDALVTAAIMHGLGDLLDVSLPRDRPRSHAHRAHAAADLLADLYPPLVTETIRLQPSARRYLAATTLTSARPRGACSFTSAMTEPERACFAKLPFAMNAVKLCRWTLAVADDPASESQQSHQLPALRVIAARSVCNDGFGWGH